jgi:signal peptidase
MLHRKAVNLEHPAETADRAERSLPSRAFNSVLEVTLIVLATVVVVAAVGPIAGWWRYEVVKSGSMAPTMRIGGVAIVEPEPISKVHVGQIIAFEPPKETYVRVHRIISLIHRGDQVWVVTKGDANNVADPGPVRLEGKTVYAERAFVPYVGHLGVWLSQKSSRQLLEAALLTLMVGGGLYLIWGKKNGEDEEHVPTLAAEPARQPVAVLDREVAPSLETLMLAPAKVLLRPVTLAPGSALPRRLSQSRDPEDRNLDLSAQTVASASTTAALLALSRMYGGGPAQNTETAGPDEVATEEEARTAR